MQSVSNHFHSNLHKDGAAGSRYVGVNQGFANGCAQRHVLHSSLVGPAVSASRRRRPCLRSSDPCFYQHRTNMQLINCWETMTRRAESSFAQVFGRVLVIPDFLVAHTNQTNSRCRCYYRRLGELEPHNTGCSSSPPLSPKKPQHHFRPYRRARGEQRHLKQGTTTNQTCIYL